MVSSENRDWLYVAIPVYFCLLAGSALWAYRRMERMEHDGLSDKLSSHYLGGRSFGPLLTIGTVFASLFSGYTVVGIPNEAYQLGWYAIRWMPATAYIGFVYYGTGLRLRKASMIRNHQSPVDIITDRYQSQILRHTMVAIQVITSIIYLAAQVIAIKGTFNSMFEIDPNANWPVCVIMGIILIFEWLGGLSSVALTDSIQGLIMLASFVILPIIIKINFGGWSDLDPETYPKPHFYATPTLEQQWKFFQFSFVGMTFFTLPHFLQRTYAARDVVSLKSAYSVVIVGPWILMLVGIYIGTVGVQMLDGAQVPSPFTSILEEVMNLGGFAKFVGVLAFTASLAAIMSTADSLIIAISQLMTVEVLYPLAQSKSPAVIAMMGRGVSFVAVALALLVGIFWDSGITDLAAIQYPLAMQGVPAFLFALFATSKATDIHPWTLATSSWVAMVYVLGIYFGYLDKHEDPAPIDAGLTGLAVQVVLWVVMESARRLLFPQTSSEESVVKLNKDETNQEAELLYPNRPAFDIPCTKRFGDRVLTPQMMWQMMEDIEEPITNIHHVAFMLLSVSLVTPFAPEGLVSDAVVNGMPWWAFKALILCAIPYAMALYVVFRMPNKFPGPESAQDLLRMTARLSSDVSPDLVELSPPELGRRVSYDAPNATASIRRKSIRKSLQAIARQSSAVSEITNEDVQQLSKMLNSDEEVEMTHNAEDELSA